MKNKTLFIFALTLTILLISGCASNTSNPVLMSNSQVKLYVGILNNNLDEVKTAISAGVDIDIQKMDGPPLNTALMKGRFEIAKYLVDSGANVNNPNKSMSVYPIDGLTSLMIASAWGNYEIVKLLIEKGADVNAIDKKGYSVLMHACSPKANTDVLDLLINNGADLNYKVPFRIGLGSERYSADILTVCAMEYRNDLIHYLKGKGFSRDHENPVVCVGYGETNPWMDSNLNKYYNDNRFSLNDPFYGGKLAHSIEYLTEVGVALPRIIGVVTPGTQTFKVRYSNPKFAEVQGKTASASSEWRQQSFDCILNNIYVFHPKLSSNSVKIEVYEFEF